jgi:lipopolysaccharide export system protein LptA
MKQISDFRFQISDFSLLALLLGLLLCLPALAQELATPPAEAAPDAPVAAAPPPTVSSGSNGPLEITADGTLEWLRDQQLYVARGNAKAVRGGMTVTADVLSARYQTPPGKKDGMQITQLQADGNVELQSPTSQAFGDQGVYDMQKRVTVLTGKALKLVTPEETVTARDSLEYYEDTDTGVARGDAVAVRGVDRLTGDVIAAVFHHEDAGDKTTSKDKKKETAAPAAAPATASPPADGAEPVKPHQLEKLEAKGHVVLVTQTDVVTGDEGVYNPNTGQATVLGNVKVTRGDNQLDGARAEVDMQTGVSRLFAAPNTKVRGLFTPQKKGETADNTTTTAVADKP